MDPAKTNDPNDQLGDVDPLELEDQELPEEEAADFVHIDDAIPEDPDQKVTQEEQDLAKVIDAVAAPVEEAPTTKKSTSHLIPRELIDRPLTFEDLLDGDDTI